MRTSQEIRQLFLDYFVSKHHMVEPGAPLVPIDDDTLLWINSGVAALKKYFDGRVTPQNPRITNVQKSIRTNDIENVGKTARHHTFFEMLGNFSIGDYFKEEAIAFAYEFLFSKAWIGLDVADAYISIHTSDDEAFKYWTENHGIDPKRILRTDDNFWQIGDGPCGPNSEIFIDRGPKYDPENIGERLFFEELENDRYIEIWNVVFSQFDGVEGGDISTFKELPHKNIDTGMGLERLVSILQDGETNFDTDLFLPLIHATEAQTKHTYADEPMAFRVIADHVRTLTFALADGATFSNEGRGYVLRRILRRAVRFGKTLEIQGAFLYNLVPVVSEIMHGFYPYLDERIAMIQTLIHKEEDRFMQTLSDGEKLLKDSLASVTENTLSGDVAFKMYDTYGFPIELTVEIAGDQGIEVDMEGFNTALEAQRELARSSRSAQSSMGSQNDALMAFKTSSEFDYNHETLDSKIIGLFQGGVQVDHFEGEGVVVLEKTPFYAESGGQVGDTGRLVVNGVDVTVFDVKAAPNGQPLHFVNTPVTLHVNDQVHADIDHGRRTLIRRNHSAVHLLQAALQTVLGSHVSQAGSYVDDGYLRFDFNHFEKVGVQDLETIEAMINQWIVEGLPIQTEVMDLESAKATGAMALFGENYGAFVRVVSMGTDVSIELCGGTHAQSVGDLGLFRIVSEESVGSGVRRITAKTSKGALESYHKDVAVLQEARDILQLPIQKTLLEGIHDVVLSLDETKAQVNTLRAQEAKHQAQAALEHVSEVGNLRVLSVSLDHNSKEMIAAVSDSLRPHVDVLLVVNRNDDALSLLVAASKAAQDQGIKAGMLVKGLAQLAGGNGGGRPDFAQAGAKDTSKVDDIMAQFMTEVQSCA